MTKLRIDLKTKMTLLLFIQVLLLIIIVAGVLHLEMLGSILKLEDKYVSENVERVNNAIDYQIEYLSTLAYDWAVWDDTYDFIQNMNSQYIESNLTSETIQNIGVGIMCFINPTGEALFTAINDNGKVVYLRDTSFESKLFQELSVLANQKKDVFEVNGFVTINSKPYIFSMSQIKKTNGSGKRVGYILFATEISEDFVNALNQQYLIDMQINAVDKAVFPNSDEISKHEVSKKLIFNDVFNKPLFLLQVNIKRELYSIANSGLNRTLLIIITILSLFGLIVNRFWNKEVISRLFILREDVKRLKGNLSQDSIINVLPEGQDEIDILRYEIYAMHQKIYEQNDDLKVKQVELEALNNSLEQHVNQRTIDLVEVNKRLIESEDNYRTIVNEFPDLIFKIGNSGVFLACEGGLQNQLIISKDFFIGKKFEDVLPVELSALLNSNIRTAYQERSQVEFEYQLSKDNVVRYYRAKLIPQVNEELFIFISDITESYMLLKEVEQLSYYDQLTGVYNRRFLEVEFQRLNSSRNLPFTVLALDVNGLKMINDAFGHLSGDYLLCEIANVIKNNLRSEDIVARMGGDEFFVLLPKTNESRAIKMMEKIRTDVNAIDVNGIESSISVGYYTVNEEPMSLDDIVKNADERMYKQKSCESQTFRLNALFKMQEKLIKMNKSEKLSSDYVSELVIKIGNKLNLSKSDLKDLYLTAKYHDVGKLSISEEVLIKTSKLSFEEYEKIKRHCEIGFQIIKSVDTLVHVAESVLHHHEHWDGSGYPKGLSGDRIPLFSRIIHVADSYEAMIHFRPYKSQKTIEEAANELMLYSGKQFDPDVVKALIEVLNQ